MSNKDRTVKLTVYIPPFHSLLLQMMATKNGETMSAIAKRLLLGEIEEASSLSFRASNSLHSALKNEEVPDFLREKIGDYLQKFMEQPSGIEEDEESDD